MKKLSSKYALLVFLALVLGVGLLAAAPAQALVVHVDFPDITINTANVDPDNFVLPDPGAVINPMGVDHFRIDLLGIIEYELPGSLTGLSVDLRIQNGRAGGMTPLDSGEVFGYNAPATVTVLGTEYTLLEGVPYVNYLAQDAPIGPDNFTVMEPFELEGFQLPVGGFAARTNVDVWIEVPFIGGYWQDIGNLSFGDWYDPDNAVEGYVGFRFPGDSTHYGWVHLTVGPDAGYLVVHDFAYEDFPGAEILAGQTTGGVVPIPGSILLLGSGLMGLGLLGWRRKKS
jgi:hypothetical protein